MASAHNQPVPSPQPSSATDSTTGAADGVIYVSASRAASTYNSDEMYNPVCKGVRLYLDVTNINAGNIIIKIQVRDPYTDKWVDLTGATSPTAGAAWASNQTRTLTVYPGITAAVGTATTNTEVSAHLGLSWRVSITNSSTQTFSLGAEYIL